MEVRTKDIKIIKAKHQVEKVLERYGVEWDDLWPRWHSLERDAQDRDKEREAWEKVRGMLKGRKGPDPVKWQRKIRKEWDRKIL